MSEPIRCVLFDLDGTLIDSIPLILASFRHTFDRHLGCTPADDVLIGGIGTPLRTQLARYSDDDALVEAMCTTYRAHNLGCHDELLRSFPAVNAAVEKLAKHGLKMGVVTSKARDTALRGLRLCALDHHFPVVVGLEDTALHKPHAEPVLLGLSKVGARPEESVYIGDSPHDLLAGRAAGTRTGAVGWGPFPRSALEACAPDWYFDTPEDMLARLI